MDLHFGRHARNRLRLYKVSAEDATAVLLDPVLREPDKEGRGRLDAWGQASDGRWLIVVYVVEGARIEIVNVIPKRRPPR